MNENQPQSNVIIYSASWCGYCRLAKEYFKEHDITYTEYDVEKDPEKGREAMEKSGQIGVPIIMIDNNVIVGFDPDRIESFLRKPAQTTAAVQTSAMKAEVKKTLPEIVMYTTQ